MQVEECQVSPGPGSLGGEVAFIRRRNGVSTEAWGSTTLPSALPEATTSRKRRQPRYAQASM